MNNNSEHEDFFDAYGLDDFDQPKQCNPLVWLLPVVACLILISGTFIWALNRRNPTIEAINTPDNASIQTSTVGVSSTQIQSTEIIDAEDELGEHFQETVPPPHELSGQSVAYIEYSLDRRFIAGYDMKGSVVSEVHQSEGFPETLPYIANLALPFDLTELNNIGLLTAAMIDPQNGQLILIGEPADDQTDTSANDFLVALQCVFSGMEPGVSIDPGTSQTTQTVRYMGPTEGTNFGWIMFEADRLMKNLSLGQDNETGLTVDSEVQGHGSMFDFSFTSTSEPGQEIRRRFWFIVDKVQLGQTSDRRGIVFQDVGLQVETEYLDENWQTMLNQPPDPVGQAFADQLTENYHEYASEFPIFRDLEALVRWLALARWIKANPNLIDASALLSTSIEFIDTPETTPAITVIESRKNDTGEEQISIWGGVDLGFVNNYNSISLEDGELLANAQASLDDRIETNIQISLQPFESGFSYIPNIPSIMSFSGGEQPFGLVYDSSAPVSNLFSSGWSLETPHLDFLLPRQLYEEYAQELYPTIVWVDPLTRQRHALLYRGNIDSNNNLVYFNEQAGLILTEIEGKFFLELVTFNKDNSYYLNPGFRQVFNGDGQLISWETSDDNAVEYAYIGEMLVELSNSKETLVFKYTPDGLLSSIENLDNGTLYQLGYNDRELLETISSTTGEILASFSYDSEGQLVAQLDEKGQPLSYQVYDAEHRVQARVVDSSLQIFDLLPDGGTRLYDLGPSSSIWLEAFDHTILDALKTVLRISQAGIEIDHVLYLRKLPDRALVLIDGHTYQLSLDALVDANNLRNAITNLNLDVAAKDRILVLDGDSQGVDFEGALLDVGWWNTEDLDESQILKKLEGLKNPPHLSPFDASVIMGAPSSDPVQVEAANLDPEDSKAWDGVGEAIVEMAQRHGYLPVTVSDQVILSERIKDALQKKATVLIVVAHSDGQRIYLPDGTYFSPEDLEKDIEAVQAIQERQPVVILAGCQTAKMKDLPSLAKQIVDLGALFVVAPEGDISAWEVVDYLDLLFSYSSEGQNIIEAVENINRELIKQQIKIRMKKIIGQHNILKTAIIIPLEVNNYVGFGLL